MLTWCPPARAGRPTRLPWTPRRLATRSRRDRRQGAGRAVAVRRCVFAAPGYRPRYTFRALLGCDEEVGMTDVHHYLETHEQPAFLFTPDAEFPVCNAEKGCFGGTFTSAPIANGAILSWERRCGRQRHSERVRSASFPWTLRRCRRRSRTPTAWSVSPRLRRGPHADRRPRHRRPCLATGGHGERHRAGGGRICVRSPAALPELFAAEERDFLEALARPCTPIPRARGLGIACTSEAFGPLTCNAGTIEVAGGRIAQTIDVRFPDATTAEQMAAACCMAVEGLQRAL